MSRFRAVYKKYDYHILASLQALVATAAAIPGLFPDKDVKWAWLASALLTFAYAVLKPNQDSQDG